MARRVVNAESVKPGDILAASLENEVFSVRQVYTESIPGRNAKEVVIKGPLGVIVKKAQGAKVTILV